MNKRSTILLIVLCSLSGITAGAMVEQPMTAEERREMYEARERTRVRDAYYKRIGIMIGESDYPDGEFVQSMPRGNHRWCAESLRETSLKLETTTADLEKAKTELSRIKEILLRIRE